MEKKNYEQCSKVQRVCGLAGKKNTGGMGILRTGGIGKYFFQQLSK